MAKKSSIEKNKRREGLVKPILRSPQPLESDRQG